MAQLQMKELVRLVNDYDTGLYEIIGITTDRLFKLRCVSWPTTIKWRHESQITRNVAS